MITLLASAWGAPAIAALCLAAVTAGATLGATWDRATTTIRAARAAYHTPPTGSHRR